MKVICSFVILGHIENNYSNLFILIFFGIYIISLNFSLVFYYFIVIFQFRLGKEITK